MGPNVGIGMSLRSYCTRDEDEHEPAWFVVNIVDLGRHAGGADMAAALIWTVESHCELDPSKWLYSVSDSTNAMSGVRDTNRTTGGTFQHVRRHYGFKYTQPRSACTRHVVHLPWATGRMGLMGGPIPGPKEHRNSNHVWSFLWFVWQELGADSADYLEMKEAAAKVGLTLTKTWKPIHTRYHSSCLMYMFASTWSVLNLGGCMKFWQLGGF